MVDWSETYRGSVAPWECDITEHFTIAYYFDRLEQASTEIATVLGLSTRLKGGVFPRLFNLRFIRELRAGAGFHIESAAIGIDPALRLGHRFVDSATGEPVTWIAEVWEKTPLSGSEHNAVNSRLGLWEGPELQSRPEPASTVGSIATARGRIRPADLDEFERLSLTAVVHRFTDGVLQAMAAVGITADYVKNERRGFSTFELILRISSLPGVGDPYVVETGIAQLGSSSVRFLHRMIDPAEGKEFARLSQFGVQLDLDARRPAPLAEPIRAAAARLLLSSA